MVKFQVKPFASLRSLDKDDVHLGVESRFNHGDVNLKVRADDSALRGGNALSGVVVEASKANNFSFVYSLDSHQPALTFHSSATLANKNVGLKYKHDRGNKVDLLEGSFAVDDKNTATVGLDLHDYSKPDYRNLRVKWNYRHDENWSFEPEYNFGNEAFSARVNHQLDADNRLSAKYDVAGNAAELEWTNREHGLKLSAASSIASLGSGFPVVKAEKVFDLDL